MLAHRIVLSAICALGVASAPCSAESWIVRTDLWGNPAFSTFDFKRDGASLTGDLDGEKVTGRLAGGSVVFTTTDTQGRPSNFTGKIDGDTMFGNADLPDTNTPTKRAAHDFTARRIPERPSGPARTYNYAPTDYSNTWDAARKPVLTIWPGDTVRTKTIDSGGVDEKGVTRALFGNPQTGPFFIAGAKPGDTLVVRIRKLSLNRDYADSLDSIVPRALGTSLVAAAESLGKPVRWTIDRKSGRAHPENATGALANYSVPLRPMLGGLAVAPGFGWPAISTGDTGRFGGNMDFPDVVEGNTVYLTVQQPGALLYLGDAHALQGDGETTQYGLETSMDVTFSVGLIKGESISTPRVESPSQLMVLGQAGSLDDAVKAANSGMLEWLQKDYDLTLSQAAQVMGSAVQFNIVNLAGRNAGVAAKIEKHLLPLSRHVVTKDESSASGHAGSGTENKKAGSQ